MSSVDIPTPRAGCASCGEEVSLPAVRSHDGRYFCTRLACVSARVTVPPASAPAATPEPERDPSLVRAFHRRLDKMPKPERPAATPEPGYLTREERREFEKGMWTDMAPLVEAPAAPTGEEAEPWVVWSNEHRLWWRAKSCGYTPSLLRAGLYSEAEARNICTLRCVPGSEVAYPLSEALAKEGDGQPGATVVARLTAQATALAALRARVEHAESLLVAFVAWDDDEEETSNRWDEFDTLCNDARAALAPRQPTQEDTDG